MLHIPEQWKPFVNDYKMILVEARENALKLHNINNQDLFNLLEILLDTTSSTIQTKEKAMQYSREHRTEKEVVMTVAGATNCKLDYNALKKGDRDMCRVFEETWLEGKAEGLIMGKAETLVETGLEFGLTKEDIIQRLQNKLNVSLSQAQEYFTMFNNKSSNL